MPDLDRLFTPEERLGAGMPDDRERDGACVFGASGRLNCEGADLFDTALAGAVTTDGVALTMMFLEFALGIMGSTLSLPVFVASLRLIVIPWLLA